MDNQEREQKKTGDKAFHAQSVEEVLEQLDVTADGGLAEAEIRTRRERYGPNELDEESTPSPYVILLNQFKSIVILILAAAAVVAFLTARWPEGIVDHTDDCGNCRRRRSCRRS